MKRNGYVLMHFVGTAFLVVLGLMLALISAVTGATDTVQAADVYGLAGIAIFCLLVAAPAMALIEHGWMTEERLCQPPA